MDNGELVIVIPAYEPNQLMLDLLEKLNQYFESCKIVIVNDGSKTADETFKKAAMYENVTILNHLVNKGKGAALKTAFKYISSMDDKNHIIVTADADGQHRPEDIFKVASYYQEIQDGVVLGSRQFDGKVPLRSRFGNDATKFLYRLFNNKKLHDNQTGLRAFGSDLIPFMVNVQGDRYEYEMNMLMECAVQSINISEVGIQTVYINNNESSHFNPVRDFLKICKHILKYAFPALITILVDILIFFQLYFYFDFLDIDLKVNVLISSFIGYLSAFLVHLIINRNGFFYGNASIFKNKKRKTKYLLAGFATVMVNTMLFFGLFILMDKVVRAKVVSEVGFVSVFLLLNYILVPKAKLH